ncbi:MFS transporter [Lysinibacillus sp. 2017]|uniref:MDR family MFS transporter n=1 Tax=unclassified Lysinibacillus TaxID=2636778 RepID=UPI000D52A7A5|nr:MULTISPECIES: MFS transporter [unclassified Lysinibacillus]AWE07125.1 MFS transporter [Lysinibacillus sp. 2017]TGN36956.1 MFS transporter [Lysinibacillus sp. S2017]
MEERFVWDTNLKVRLLGETVFNIFYWMYFPFMAIYFSQSMGIGWTGLLMTIPPIVSLIAGLVGGSYADRYGRKRLMLWGTGIQLLMFILFASSDFVWLNYFAFLGITIGKGIYKPASDAMVADTVPAEERKEVFAKFITGSNLGAVLGPIIGAWVFFDHRSLLLWSCACFLMVYFVVIYTKSTETMPVTDEVNQHKKVFSISGELRSYLQIMKDKAFALYIAAGVFSVIAIMQLDLYLAIYIYDEVPSQVLFAGSGFILSSKEILGWILGINGVIFVLFIIPVTKWLKRWSDLQVFVLSCLLAGFGMFAVGLTSNIWFLFMFTIIFTFGELVRSPVLYNFVSNYAPQHARAQYMAASNMQFTIGRFLAPMTVILSGYFSSMVVFSAILICALFSLGMYVKLHQHANP